MKTIFHILFASLLFLLIGSTAFAQKISTADEVRSDIEQVDCKNSGRLKSVVDLFKRMGATDNDIAVVEKDGTKNVVVTKKGGSGEIVVVSAHYDKTDDGCGAIDNWTGIVTMAHMYRTLREYPTSKTLKFVAFDKEEKGLVGSDVFVRQISKEGRPSYCADINLDSFGWTAPWAFQDASSKTVLDAGKAFWTEMKTNLVVASIPDASADSMSFMKAGIPAITFTGLDAHWPEFLHSSKDQVKNLKPEMVWAAYRIILPFVTEVDQQPCGSFRKK